MVKNATPAKPHGERRHRRCPLDYFLDLFTDAVTGRARLDPVLHLAAGISVIYAYNKYVTAANFETMSTVVAGIFIISNLVNRNANLKQQALNPQIVPDVPAKASP